MKWKRTTMKTVAAEKKKQKTRPFTNSEKQARWRAKQKVHIRELEEFRLRNQDPAGPDLRLRNQDTARNLLRLRNQTVDAEQIHDVLDECRKLDEHRTKVYLQLAITPGLTRAELNTIATRLAESAKLVKACKPSADRYQAHSKKTTTEKEHQR